MVSEIKDFEQRKENLIKKGKELGFITYEELAEELKGLEIGSDLLDELYNALMENDISVVSESDLDDGSDEDDGGDLEDILKDNNIKVVVHIINGLPYETKEMMIETAKTLGQLDIQALKIHMLFAVKNTKLQQMYENHEFNMLSRQEYIDIVVEQLRYIKPEIVIERLTGDGKIDDLIAPLWSIKKVTILNDIDKKMKELDVYQGDLYKK